MSGQQPPAVLDPVNFEKFRNFLHQACGIYLGESKQYLVTTRILPLIASRGLDGFGALVKELESNRHSPLRDIVIDAMTTNETFWFRDSYPFDLLKNQLLAELSAKKSSLNIWSAACSSGQEALSISMIIEEFLRSHYGALKQASIIATDLSPTMLEAAKLGIYDKLSVTRGLSSERLKSFFDPLPNERWQAKSVLRDRIRYRLQNLQQSFGGLGTFDIIFCRNVLIYFNNELKLDILQRLHRALVPGGVLVLGASEGLAGASDLFDMVHCSPGIVYRAK